MELARGEVFSYHLPKERIAQRPLYPHDSAKLLTVNRKTKELASDIFKEMPRYLRPGDILVFNDTRVIPARFFGKLSDGKPVELLFLKRDSPLRWICMGHPMRKFKPNVLVHLEHGLVAKIIDRVSEREVMVEIQVSAQKEAGADLLERIGVMPIPPYIREGLGDEHDTLDYQSIFAKAAGSVAAPTASLHFTSELIENIQKIGLRLETVTLHLGPPSFLSVWNEGENKLSPPGTERYVYSKELFEGLLKAKAEGKRVIAVGTSVVRALESMWKQLNSGTVSGSIIETDLFIYPGYDFRVVDGLVTNFHQPGSSHLLLVQAFLGEGVVGKEVIASIYEYALLNDFRFLSYGDGMLLL